MQIETGFYYDKDFVKLFEQNNFRKFKDVALFLQSLQNKESGSWVSDNTPLWAIIETNVEILGVLKDFGLSPKYKLRFLESFAKENELLKTLNSWLLGNNEDGKRRALLNRGGTKLIRFYKLATDIFSESWYETYMNFFLKWQNPKTGYWGIWIKKNSKIIKKDDLSITFHILKRFYKKDGNQRDSKYKPKHINKIIKTTWKIKNKEYPYGWLEKGKWSAHHIMDVIIIFNMINSYLNEKEKTEVNVLHNEIQSWADNEINLLIKNNFELSDLSWFAQMPINSDYEIRKKIYAKLKNRKIDDPVSFLRIVKGFCLEEFEK